MKAILKGWVSLNRAQLEQKFLEVNKQGSKALLIDIETFTPVDTGTLKASLHVSEVDSNKFTVAVPPESIDPGTGEIKNMQYAYWVENGTSRMLPRKFMLKGLNQFKNYYMPILRRVFRG